MAERPIRVIVLLAGAQSGEGVGEEERATQSARLRDAIAAEGGQLFKARPEAWFAAFEGVGPAIAAARAIQARALEGASGPQRQRMALHAGQVELRDGDYFGPPLNRVARLVAAGHPGQVLVSEAARRLIDEEAERGLRLRDLGAYRLKDLLEPERVYQLACEALDEDHPPLRSLDRHPHNLPLQRSELIGRAEALGQARRRLEDARLLSLVGEGGVGKTRLALQLGAELLDRLPGGVWWVDLTAESGGTRLDAIVAAALGIVPRPARPIEDQLVDRLEAQPCLLILDNCEHLLEPVAKLATRLLGATAETRILATSREAIRIPGEATLRVPGLRVPPPGGRRRDRVGPNGSPAAVRLFVERACAQRPSFDPADNLDAIGELVRRLDGNPLAIELAAARTILLSPRQILERLADRFALLTDGDRTASPHQRTLLATLDWSHDLLEPAERILFRRLAIFRGGWPAELSEAVCAGEGIERAQVLGALASLVRKSLVVADIGPGGSRFRMLETIRGYALRRLEASGEASWLLPALATELLGRARAMAETGADLERERRLDALAAEHDNLLAALAWCAERPEHAALGLRLATALGLYWYQRCHYRDGRRWLADRRDLLAASGLDATEQAWAHYMASLCLMGAAAYEEQAGALVEAIALFEAVDERRGLGWALNDQGLLRMNEGRYEEALRSYARSAEQKRSLGDEGDLAITLSNLGEALCRLEHREEGRSRFEEAAAIQRRLGGSVYLTDVAFNLGDLALERGDLDEADARFRESLDVALRFGETYMAAKAVIGFARLAWARGDAELAARRFAAAEAELERLETALEAYARPGYERDRASTRAQLGERGWEAAYAAGRSEPLEAALGGG